MTDQEDFEKYWAKVSMQYLGGASFQEFAKSGFDACAKIKNEMIKVLEKELALKDSWIKHHQGACEIAVKDRHEANDKLAWSERKLGVAVKALEFYSELTNNPIQYMRQGTLVYNFKKIAFIDGGQNAKDALKEINN